MGRSLAKDKQFLECHHGRYRVVVSVPRPLQRRLGTTKLKRSLNTDSLATANILKWKVVHELKGLIHSAALENNPKHSLTREALELATLRARADYAERQELDFGIKLRADELLGDPVAEELDPDSGEKVFRYDPEREKRAGLFASLARGEATPLDFHFDQYQKQQTTGQRTRAMDRRAIEYLKTWCAQNNIRPALQSIKRKVATRFMDELHTLVPGEVDNTTINKYVVRLRQYWKWLEKREHVTENPWLGLSLKSAVTPYHDKERPFTDAEMVRLLEGPARPELRDVMLIGALTGARIDVIVSLKVKDCANGTFMFPPRKKEKRERYVPIHSGLAGIIKRRTEGKKPDDDLFPEWSENGRERSGPTTSAFIRYRKSVGVDEKALGKRRSLVNFHSFRRWFITEAERAGCPEHIIAVVVGHKRPGETLGRYSGGPLPEQLRQCVESVKLPKHKPPKGQSV